MNHSEYEDALRILQAELVILQQWVVHAGLRVVVVFEGRDAAGKGGVIRAITERCSPRIFRTVALPAPNDREKSQLYIQRYMPHMPATGEVILFDRSWYNRAGVEPVMGFCSPEQRDRFLELTPGFEMYMVQDGIILLKYWLEVSSAEQKKRFMDRIQDPLKQWKLSPMDVESQRRWYAYSRARDLMLDKTDTDHAPWFTVDFDDQRRGRLNCISHLLSKIPYKKLPTNGVELLPPEKADRYDDVAPMQARRKIPEVF